MKNNFYFLLSLCIIAMLCFTVPVFFQAKQHKSAKIACAEKGGELAFAWSKTLCVRKEALL